MADSSIPVPRDELQFTFVRSSGPGGQNVNKVNSKAVLRWNPSQSRALPEPVRERFFSRWKSRLTAEGDLVLASQRYRDQARNVEDCIAKLAEMIRAVARPPKKRRPTRPSQASKERRLDSKRRGAAKKQSRRKGWNDA